MISSSVSLVVSSSSFSMESSNLTLATSILQIKFDKSEWSVSLTCVTSSSRMLSSQVGTRSTSLSSFHVHSYSVAYILLLLLLVLQCSFVVYNLVFCASSSACATILYFFPINSSFPVFGDNFNLDPVQRS